MSDAAQVARAWVDAWNRGDEEAFAGMLAPDVEWHDRPEFPDATVIRGREAVIAHVRELTSSVDVTWDLRAADVVGDRARFEAVLTLRGHESGVEVVREVHPVVTVRDGLIVRRENYSSREEALRAVGRA